MDYKKLNKKSSKTTIEQMIADGVITQEVAIKYFPELKESEDERIRKELIDYFSASHATDTFRGISWARVVAWLEKQGEPKSYWKPSKDEMDALYGLAYITNTMDDKKDEAVTKLYQDLKREFFNGASYENMFPSSPVDAPIKDEKQGEQKDILEDATLDNNEDGLIADTIKVKSEQKPEEREFCEHWSDEQTRRNLLSFLNTWG